MIATVSVSEALCLILGAACFFLFILGAAVVLPPIYRRNRMLAGHWPAAVEAQAGSGLRRSVSSPPSDTGPSTATSKET